MKFPPTETQTHEQQVQAIQNMCTRGYAHYDVVNKRGEACGEVALKPDDVENRYWGQKPVVDTDGFPLLRLESEKFDLVMVGPRTLF